MGQYTAPKLEFEPKSHTYRLNGVELVSVTTMLGTLYRGRRAGPEHLEQTARRGTIIHALTEHDDLGDGPPLHQGAQEAGSRAAWQSWRRIRGFKPKLIECRLASERLRIAGTVDRIGWFAATQRQGVGLHPTDPTLGIVDIKSGAIPDTCAGQLAAYRAMAYEQALVEHDCPIVAVALRDDGSWFDVWYRGGHPDTLWQAAWTYHFGPGTENHKTPPIGKDGYQEG